MGKGRSLLIRILFKKLRESLIAVLPVTAIVFLLNLTPLVEFTAGEMTVFLVSAFFLILGIALFNLGADLAMSPMGEYVGVGLTRSRKPALLLLVSFAMGLLITVAEPDLSVLASQVKDVIGFHTLIFSVGTGVGLFLVLAVLKIILRRRLSDMLIFFYMLLFALTSLMLIRGNDDLLALAFDSGGVTTGPITVPFLMALGIGIAATLGGRNIGENSFGLIAMCSIGPVLAVLIIGILAKGSVSYTLPDYSIAPSILAAVGSTLLSVAKEILKAIGLVLIFFLLLQFFYLKLPVRRLGKIFIGIGYTVFGLLIFLTSVTVGFMPIGYKLGTELAGRLSEGVAALAFLLGAVTVLAEPAVHVLNKQVEEVTSGTVSKRSMMLALSVGVGLSLALSVLRMRFDFSLLYYLIPGYLLSVGLSFFVPGLYTAIAFDAGGVASGPLTSSFILPFAVGVCCVMQGEGKILSDAFGIVAMVAMTPLITIQLLGFRAVVMRKVREKIAMKRIMNSDDEQIIRFM